MALPMTIAEKIIATHSGRQSVAPGEYVWASVDGTGVIGPVPLLEELGIERLFDPDRVYVVDDHFAPAPTVARANIHREMKLFAEKYGIENYFEHGRHGILHELFPDHGYVSPGDLIASVDSHSTSYGCFNVLGTPINEELALVLITGEIWLRVPETVKFVLTGKLPFPCVGKDIALKLAGEFGTDVAQYRSIEYAGPAVRDLTMGSRFTLANMGVELGAKCALFEADEVTMAYLEGRMKRPPQPVAADTDARYLAEYFVDVSSLEPMIAMPHDPGNVFSVSAIEGEGLSIDQAFLGSCTNARVEDIAIAANIMRGRKVHEGVRMIVTPASSAIWRECVKLGYFDVLSEAGAMITNPGCGACPGASLGLLADSERCISSSNRNFQGRMGSTLAEVCLASPATVAASALTGEITDPRRFLGTQLGVPDRGQYE